MSMVVMIKEPYQTPAALAVQVKAEGVICLSNQDPDPNPVLYGRGEYIGTEI